jgi:hypothetical protein
MNYNDSKLDASKKWRRRLRRITAFPNMLKLELVLLTRPCPGPARPGPARPGAKNAVRPG